MKKATKPSAAKKPAPKRPATKPLAAKPKVTAKSSPKPKLRKTPSQAELLPILERLTQSAERLAQAAEQLAQAAAHTSATAGTEQPERQVEMLEQAGNVIEVVVVDETEEE